jgi:ribose transport system permease protein
MSTDVASRGAPARPAPPALRARLARIGAAGGLLLLLVFNVLFTEHFLSLQTLAVNLSQVTTVVIVAVGMTLVIATGGIDLSVGAVMALAGTLAPLVFGAVPGPAGLALAFVLPLVVAWCCGWFNGLLVTRYAIQPIVATLVLFTAGRGIAQVATGGQLQTFVNPGFAWLGSGRVLGLPVQALLMLLVVAAAAWLLGRTVFGRQVVAIGSNRRAAALAGIAVGRVQRHVYALSGALAGLAGLVVVALNSASDANLNGLGMELDAIAAVAVGGTLLSGGRASIVGTLLGALFIQLLRYTLLAHGVPDAAALVVKAVLIVLAVWLQRGAAR